MNDEGHLKLERDILGRIAPLIEGKPNIAVMRALIEVLIFVALNGQKGKSRASALELISIVIEDARKSTG